jgi:hypothetical protein
MPAMGPALRSRSFCALLHRADAQEEKIVAKKVDMMQLKLKKAQEVAWSPGKNFMMTAFMLWMSGSGVHIFSIMITFYAVYNPIKSAFTVQQQFSRFEDPKMTGPERARLMSSKLMFVAMNLFAMTGALYKMSTMGLLPNTPSDWVGMLSVPPNLQLSTGSSL